MNGKGRKLFRSAVGILTSVMMMGAYTTTAMASGIGVIDAKDMLDIHAEANTASAVVGQVMEDGHVAILAKYNDWVQIQAGEIAGWVPAENLVETEISNEEAVAAKEIIEGSTVEIAAKVSESGKLFGGISAEKIAIALSSKVEVNPKNITVEPIKTTGDFPATVALHPEITANFFVKVVAE